MGLSITMQLTPSQGEANLSQPFCSPKKLPLQHPPDLCQELLGEHRDVGLLESRRGEDVQDSFRRHRALDVIDADIVAEDCTGVAVLKFQRCAGEGDKGSVGKRIGWNCKEGDRPIVCARLGAI